MLGLDHRIVLEDHLGERHPLNLLEIIADRYFVLLPPTQARKLKPLQQTPGGKMDDALDILTNHVSVISVRDHRFLTQTTAAEVLGRSRHHILRLVGLRLGGDLPPCTARAEEFSISAFQEELERRSGW